MLRIYGVPISVHTRKVIVAALEKKLPYHNEPVIPFKPPAGWDRLSPTGKIPVVSDGDLDLADSSVICAYLERTHPTPALYPADTRAHCRALWFEEYADGTVFREVIHGLFFQTVIRPKLLGESTDTAAVEAIQAQAMPRVFGYLEESLEGGHLAGGQFSIADIALVSNLINYNYLGFRIDARRFPRLAAYFARQLRHPSIATALAGEQAAASGMGLDRSFVETRNAA
jgi:glutathione S-transferase